MATTPEGKVKKIVSAILDRAGAYYFMPVQNGMGKRGLDYHGISKGRGFTIETKRPKKSPTALQEQTMKEVRAAGGRTFVIDGTDRFDTYRDLAKWLLEG